MLVSGMRYVPTFILPTKDDVTSEGHGGIGDGGGGSLSGNQEI
jgi:hypothetical protein